MGMTHVQGKPAPAAIERFGALALRHDVSLGVLLSTHPRDFAIVLAAAAQWFPASRTFNEREVNALLRDFLAGAGSMLGTDHVELRRWLVDFHLLDRDGYGRAYMAGTPTADFADFARQLEGVDLLALARGAREEDATRRAQRKERWQKAERDSHG
jgi:hypothetical protein